VDLRKEETRKFEFVESKSWKKMAEIVTIPPDENISALKNDQNLVKFPHLIVLIKELRFSGADASGTFADPSGTCILTKAKLEEQFTKACLKNMRNS
jgi:hypothetical protein